MTSQQELLPVSVGERLKTQRLKQKLKLEVISKALGLDRNVLESIEEDRAGHMATVYRNGYIRSYARYLKITEDDIATMLDLKQDQTPALQSVFTTPVKRNSVDNWLRATSYVLASLLIGTLAWQFTHEAVRLTQNGSSLQTTKLDSSSDTGQSVETTISSPVNASIASLDNLKTNQYKQPDITLSEIPDTTQVEPATQQDLLNLKVSADSWVEITDADGLKLEMDLLRAGSEKNYQGQAPFKLVFGRASAVRLSLNGEAIDLVPFTKGDVIQLTWPPLMQAENHAPDQQ
jgi:cytoskeleton protein RodZ